MLYRSARTLQFGLMQLILACYEDISNVWTQTRLRWNCVPNPVLLQFEDIFVLALNKKCRWMSSALHFVTEWRLTNKSTNATMYLNVWCCSILNIVLLLQPQPWGNQDIILVQKVCKDKYWVGGTTFHRYNRLDG